MPRIQYQHHLSPAKYYPSSELEVFEFVLVYRARCRHHSLPLPSPSTWWIQEHPLPLQRACQWHFHRELWHAGPTLFTEQNSYTSLTRYPLPALHHSTTSPLKSSKTPATQNPSKSSPKVWILLHAYTNQTQAHFSPFLSLHSHYHIWSPLWLSTFLSQQHYRPRPEKCRSKIKFQSPYLFPIKPSPSSDVSPPYILFIVPLLRRLYTTLGLPLPPPPACHFMSISSPPSDKTCLNRVVQRLDLYQGRQQVYLLCCYYKLVEHAQ